MKVIPETHRVHYTCISTFLFRREQILHYIYSNRKNYNICSWLNKQYRIFVSERRNIMKLLIENFATKQILDEQNYTFTAQIKKIGKPN